MDFKTKGRMRRRKNREVEKRRREKYPKVILHPSM